MNGEEANSSSPKLISDVVYKWLNNALDYGITELDFWNMTPGEVFRAIESKKRVLKIEAQEKASYDYILADLIGRSMARLYNSSATYPELGAVYPSLFDTQEIEQKKQEKKTELSAIRFKQFADSHNKKYKEAQRV